MSTACEIFDELWNGDAVRHLGISFSNLKEENIQQLSFLKNHEEDKMKRMDRVIDLIREDFGDESLIRATFLNSPVKAFSGGIEEKDYIFMKSYI